MCIVEGGAKTESEILEEGEARRIFFKSEIQRNADEFHPCLRNNTRVKLSTFEDSLQNLHENKYF